MRKKFEMFIIVFFSFLFTVIFVPVNIKAASNIKVLAINGGDEETDTDYLYSESMFIDCLKKIKVNGQTISNENIHQFSNPTYTQLDRVINNTFSGNTSDTLSIFYYSGHGTIDGNGHAGLYTHDGGNYKFSTLYNKLKGINGKIVVILDCCYSGSFITQNYIDVAAKNKFLILTACQSTKYSPYYNKLSNIMTLFTGKKVMTTRYTDAMLKGLGYYNGKLAAYSDKNNVVTLAELFSYLNKNYKKTYSYTYNGQKGSAYIEPQKLGNVSLDFSYCSVSLNKTSATLNKGKTLQLKATVTGPSKTTKWTSSNTAVATVNSKGLVTAKTAGNATITCTANKLTAKCKVTVKNPYKITLSKASLTMYQGKSYTLKATVVGPSKKVIWKSSNKSIASVNSNGKISGKKIGSCKITATANGKSATCTVTVKTQPSANSAYKKLIQKYEAKYGEAKIYTSGYMHYWTGVCFAKLLDFNADGTKELILAYQNGFGKTDNIKYHVELWTFDGKKTKRICSSVSWTGNNCPYFGCFSIIKYGGKYLLYLSDGAVGNDIYYGKKSNGALGAVHSFHWKGDAMEGQWYYNGKPISVNEYINYYNQFHSNSIGYGFSSEKFDNTIRNELVKAKKALKM